MKFSKKILLFSLFTGSIILVSTLVYWDAYFFVVKKVNVVVDIHAIDSKKVTFKEEAVRSALKKLNRYKSKNILQLDLDRISQEILDDRKILSARVQRELPMQLSAVLVLRDVALVYQDKKGRVYPISSDGVLLDSLPLEKAPDAPMIRDEFVAKNLELMKRIVSLIAQLPESGTVSRSTVSEVRWTEAEGLKIELMDIGAGVVILGEKEIQLRAKRVANVIKYLESQKQKWRVIDASFSKKVLVRLRKHS